MSDESNPFLSAIDVCVVIACMAIAAVAFFGWNIETRRTGPPRASCKSNLKLFGVALFVYMETFADRVPDADGVRFLEMLFRHDAMPDALLYACPSTQARPVESKLRALSSATDGSEVSYSGRVKSRTPLDNAVVRRNASKTAVASDMSIRNHGDVWIVLFFDGHVEDRGVEQFAPGWLDSVLDPRPEGICR